MRKLVCCIMAITLVLFCSTAAASETGLSSMTIEELLMLSQKVDAEITERFEQQARTYDIIYPSVYVVGKDIKAGAYIFTNMGNSWSQLNLFASETAYEQGDYEWETLSSGDVYRLNLIDGMVIEVCNTQCKIELAPSMVFAP